MKAERIVRVLELVGNFIPGVHELTLLVPAFFGLYYAARALGFDVDLEPEAVMAISVTFSCLVWVTLNSLAYSRTEATAETTNETPRVRDSSSASQRPRPLEVREAIDRTAETQPKEKTDSVHVR